MFAIQHLLNILYLQLYQKKSNHNKDVIRNSVYQRIETRLSEKDWIRSYEGTSTVRFSWAHNTSDNTIYFTILVDEIPVLSWPGTFPELPS